ncbi:MAG: hypothetical protein C4K58_06815 [Flavobacteriaceae bacterium]|nr:MAG: hypothetical protein C4K58_06815 [Flavobacteriaceae bacterium]
MNVYSWYQKNFEFLVTIPFLQDTKQYQEAGINDTRLYFDVFLIYQKNMFDFFPGVLLGLIKNQKTKRHGV